ncbi:MAG: cupin domain-containing protein [Pseudomonadota bacterium]
MQINADFTKRAVVHAAEEPWVASPMPGVERRMLDRIGEEVARATSIVRFAPGSAFSAHTHDGGEEYLVLEGVFQDDDGDFPVGTYVRNPPTSAHTPASQEGCVILVKLHQFDPEDRTQIRVDTVAADPVDAASRPGVQTVPLHTDARETVRIEHWAPGAEVTLPVPGGLEAFVLDGGFEEGGEQFARHSWLRLPEGATLSARAGTDGARLWVKTGHLAGAEGSAPF